ncbi:MAG TPA: dihydroneopterin aldolase [Saprospiraceae bacterium]|nr:dihydroneopterin aldolase [Saprospiraceae bacterium]MCB9328884.1 dihydroneopterin aldolase [Lewinellaceae bacterium]HPK08841.1 dihydroneopterin aldolase [Saprospiraceae bacterium]HPQ20877.1 dihydroneopterin aldolase [Saprospiraceae bacterium]HRX28003.1 dihydroneopterin aldolase [Saprospiraceae bacterium]
MKTKVALKGIEFYAFHGFHEIEQKMGNKFAIDVEVELKSFDSVNDDINDTLDYDILFQLCKEEMANTQKLLETVVFNIIQKLKKLDEHVTAGKVSLAKFSPPLDGKIEKAVITMEF